MRWWLWLLLVVNVGLLAYFNLDTIVPKPPAEDRTISAEKLKVLSAKELEAMPKREAPPPPEVVASPAEITSCYKWGNFSSTNLPSAQVVLVRLGLSADVNQEAVANQDRRFWVYYPPLKNAELAQQKANEIRGLGVEELFIVQDSQWRNAISFGLFNEEQLASNLLKDLQDKGVKGVTKALRNPGKALSSLLIKGVTPAMALELHKTKHEFLGTELAPAACS
jgi:hypothetical protein